MTLVRHRRGNTAYRKPLTLAAGRMLHLVGHGTAGGGVDAPPKGPSVGDQFFESGSVTDRQGRPLGRFTLSTQLVAGNGDVGFEQSETVAIRRSPDRRALLDAGHRGDGTVRGRARQRHLRSRFERGRAA